MSKLKEYETAQKNTYETLMAKANGLMDVANTIGLAKAFNKLKETFGDVNKVWNGVFVGSLATMFIVAIVITTSNGKKLIEQNITTPPTMVTANTYKSEWEDISTRMLKGIPFYVPLIWLAVFSSRRRSENKRLEQEYAHKEALAITYDSYKKQIKELDDEENKELLIKLLDKAIDTVAHNVSETLENGKHNESTPSHELLKEFSNGIAKIITIIRK